jgi:hypothetical protein
VHVRSRFAFARRALSITALVVLLASILTVAQETTAPQTAAAFPFSAPVGSGNLHKGPTCTQQPRSEPRTDAEGKTYYVTVTRYFCEWVEKETKQGFGYWDMRPELIRFGYDGTFIVRTWPTFTDDDLLPYYFQAYPSVDSTADGSTLSNSLPRQVLRPCMYKSLNGDPTIQLRDGINVDKIDWARQVFYEMDIYTKVTAIYDRDGETGTETVVTSPFPQILRSPSEGTNFTRVRWTSCEGTGVGSGGGVGSKVDVRVQCPVYATPIKISGPYGVGLPSRSSISSYAEQTEFRTITIDERRYTQFGTNQWNRLKQPRTFGQGASEAIDLVRNCRAGQTVDVNETLPSPGNYDVKLKMWFVECGYSFFPGYTNGAYFGGCQEEASISKMREYPINSKCDGRMRMGADNIFNFDPAVCYTPTCVWKGASVGGKTVIANAPETPPDLTPLEDTVVGPRNARVFANGSPTVWNLGLERLQVANNGTPTSPVPVPGTRYTVFQLATDSTPWNPRLPRTQGNVNVEPHDPPRMNDQYFYSTYDGSPGALSFFLPTLRSVDPKDSPRRLEGWGRMRLYTYAGSQSMAPFTVEAHRMQSWRLPTFVATVGTAGEYEADTSGRGVTTVQLVLRCSAETATVSYVGNRITPGTN